MNLDNFIFGKGERPLFLFISKDERTINWRRKDDNIFKHNVDFITAAKAFKDPKRKIFVDSKHSKKEK